MKPALRIVAVVEAISFLVLIAAAIVKRGFDGPETGVEIMGPVHGVLFLLYLLLTVIVAVDEKWQLKRTLLTMLCAVLPFGGFFADRRLIDQPAPVEA